MNEGLEWTESRAEAEVRETGVGTSGDGGERRRERESGRAGDRARGCVRREM